MGTSKRERQKAGRQQRLIEAEEARKRAERRSQLVWVGVAGVILVLLLGITAWRSRSSSDSTAATTTTASTPTTAQASPLPTVAPGATVTGATPCPAVDGSSPRTTTFAQPPPMCIDPAKTYTAKVSTTAGEFTIALDPKIAPKTVNNFVVLSRYHFYDGVPFHRVVTGFVAQTGDPTGKPAGTGSPGYKIDDELPKSVDEYKPGSVAMANSGPNTNGGQWFVWVGPNKLPTPAYSLFGQVTEGLDTTIPAIMAGGSGGSDGTPRVPTTINWVIIGEDGTYPTPPGPAVTTTTAVSGVPGAATAPGAASTPSVSAPGAASAPGAGAAGAPSTPVSTAAIANNPVGTAGAPPITTPTPTPSSTPTG